MPNGDPAEPYAPNLQFDGCILLPPASVPPLYKEEMGLKLRAGTNWLLERMTKKRIGDAIDPCRPNAAKKLFDFL